jgi:hypothetical protein
MSTQTRALAPRLALLLCVKRGITYRIRQNQTVSVLPMPIQSPLSSPQVRKVFLVFFWFFLISDFDVSFDNRV